VTDFLTLAELLAIHQDQIERYGGSVGVRDLGLLAATYTFLAINGARITADADNAYVFISGLYEANDFTFEKLVVWLRHNVAQ
jgi:death on curing protein